MGNKGATEAAASRRLQALELRKAGASYRAIGQRLGVSHKTAHGDIQKALQELAALEANSAAELRQLEAERLDGLFFSLNTQLRGGSLQAIDRALHIIEVRAKLLGLNAPTKTEVTGADGAPQRIIVEYEG